jgi:putative membrane protein
VLDLVLAIAHHLLIFALFGLLVAEMLLVRRAGDPGVLQRLALVDGGYGGVAGMTLIVGICRAVFAAKGWDYYAHNGFFWAKVAAFAAIGLLSIPGTRAFLIARRAGHGLAAGEIGRARGLLHAQSGLFVLVLVFAAAMARGYGAF